MGKAPGAPLSPWRIDSGAAGLWTAAVDHLIRVDPEMARLIERVGPCTLAPTGLRRPFEALVETIVYQQLSGKAAATIVDRVRALFGKAAVDAGRMASVDDEQLRSAGLSAPKIRAVRDLTLRTLDGSLPLGRLSRLPDQRLAEVLTRVSGIGPWSVQMVLIFRLGRPDVWPASDLGIRKGAMRVWGLSDLPSATELEALGSPLAPHRTVAAWYLWRSLEIPEAAPPGTRVPGRAPRRSRREGARRGR